MLCRALPSRRRHLAKEKPNSRPQRPKKSQYLNAKCRGEMMRRDQLAMHTSVAYVIVLVWAADWMSFYHLGLSMVMPVTAPGRLTLGHSPQWLFESAGISGRSSLSTSALTTDPEISETCICGDSVESLKGTIIPGGCFTLSQVIIVSN
jgi:hypothetical protein